MIGYFEIWGIRWLRIGVQQDNEEENIETGLDEG